MKKILTIIFWLSMTAISAQTVPDTIWVESLTDTTFVVAVGTMNSTNNRLNVEYIDQVFDSAGVAYFAFHRIESNESDQRLADLTKLKADALTALYTDVNSILLTFSGDDYLTSAFVRYSFDYVGYYRARLGQSQIFVQLKNDATAIQVDSQGQEVQNGFAGTWDIINQSRFRLKDFFPENILPAGSVFNRLENPDNSFMAVGSDVILTKVR